MEIENGNDRNVRLKWMPHLGFRTTESEFHAISIYYRVIDITCNIKRFQLGHKGRLLPVPVHNNIYFTTKVILNFIIIK